MNEAPYGALPFSAMMQKSFAHPRMDVAGSQYKGMVQSQMTFCLCAE